MIIMKKRLHRKILLFLSIGLFTSSSENQANEVSILFYGQSIVAGLDAEALVNQLRKYYPCAQIEFKNRAIGGFQAPNLVIQDHQKPRPEHGYFPTEGFAGRVTDLLKHSNL